MTNHCESCKYWKFDETQKENFGVCKKIIVSLNNRHAIHAALAVDYLVIDAADQNPRLVTHKDFYCSFHCS